MEGQIRIEEVLGSAVRESTRLGGGCIGDSQHVHLADGRSVFVKQGTNGRHEANGLAELARPKVIRIPEVLYASEDLLILEMIKTGPQPAGFMRTFGEQFAELHRSEGPAFGFHENNLIGATRQINRPTCEGWADFYWTHRLEPQLQWAVDKGFDHLSGPGAALEARLPELLAGSEETPRLLHGDLWSGNFLCDAAGQAVLIDPATYYGHREADLGMTHLFGGFSPDFYRAYNDAHPLPDGADHRVPLYELYHVLNHLNLFGRSYLNQAISILNAYI